VERISPEAPVPVLRVAGEQCMPGGAANVARNVSALGARAQLVGVRGDDAEGRELEQLLSRDDRLRSRLVALRDRPTSLKTRFVAGAGQQLLRVDREEAAPLDEGARRRVVERVAEGLPACGVVVLSDYGKGVLSGELAAELIAVARAAGRRVVVDPKGRDYGRYRGSDVVTPNLRELCEATGVSARSDDEIAAAAAQLIAECGLGAVLVTRGERGMTLVEATGTARHVAADRREVFDVSGAGDTAVAALAASLSAGAELAEAAEVANAAAGVAVAKLGTAVVSAAELAAALQARERGSEWEKVAGLPAAAERVAGWRSRGLRIGFTNGCFDLLHPGHVSLLSRARAACDRLVVGLNSDASVRRLKGSGRPVRSQGERAAVLASLRSVDLVVLFDEDTPLSLIQALRPQLLVKGADYRIEQVAGAREVHSWGGEVLLLELLPGHSTSSTLARMAG
jgi:D-beta-D-heptose 7-phosphate kinase/D-beta-D-heptose 1-phosphate adenosyltransferase